MENELEKLRNALAQATSHHERIAILDALPPVQQLLSKPSFFRTFIQGVTPECECVLKQLTYLNQVIEPHIDSAEKWRDLTAALVQVDRFYWEIGGIVGYQAEVLNQLKKKSNLEALQFHSPVFDDISKETKEVKEAIFAGLKSMPSLAELYPLGGAADRLHLVDKETGQELPAAKLLFAGRPLLETLIRDLEAREWLYYRLFGSQVTTPIAIMSSYEKQNYLHVMKVCEDHSWFGRPKDRFRFFVQPLVPAVDEEGNWHKSGPLKPLLKPGGHGAIWKLAKDEGIFSWLISMHCKKTLVRQINNPLAGLDYCLLAFTGIGCMRDMSFGFASCSRRVNSAEGMVVLIEKPTGEIVLTNIEYCDFAKFGIEDIPISPDQPYSRFGSNTNILFADLGAVEEAVRINPFPGLLMNLKAANIVDESGEPREAMVGRLESTMQNIADTFKEPKGNCLKTEKTFAVHNARHKTISVAKKAYQDGKSLVETPEFCFYELLFAARELLEICGFSLPPLEAPEQYMAHGPSVLFLYHGALGPLYSVIAQKIRGGSFAAHSELILEIAELDLSNLTLDGSLQIVAHQMLGKIESGVLHFSEAVGRCVLHNVIVSNKGIDPQQKGSYWKMELHREQTVKIELKGNSEFDARDITLVGSHHFIVEDGIRMVVREIQGKLHIEKEPIQTAPLWTYKWSDGVKLYRT